MWYFPSPIIKCKISESPKHIFITELNYFLCYIAFDLLSLKVPVCLLICFHFILGINILKEQINMVFVTWNDPENQIYLR
uniref:Uncharacterized protein n=1 Tax=Mus musculus TaxID=10090 RepID=Q3UTD4_MOUSE|nr:unnamed protein product [Mus musculus]